MNIKQVGDIHEISFDHKGDNWEQYVLFMSDVHFDSKKCDRLLLRQHLDQARERNAPVFIFGDLLDVMGTKHDPRSHMSDIRPEYVKGNYLDAVVKDAAKFLKDYPVAFLSHGNHEKNILKRHETDVIQRVAERIGCCHAGYAGYIRFHFSSGGERVRKLDLYFNHGSGGNSPVTKGVIQTNRRGVAFDADILVSGHNHNRFHMELMRQWVDNSRKIRSRPQNHLNTGTYKDQDDWEMEKGFPSPNKGGIWLRFTMKRSHEVQDIRVEVVNA